MLSTTLLLAATAGCGDAANVSPTADDASDDGAKSSDASVSADDADQPIEEVGADETSVSDATSPPADSDVADTAKAPDTAPPFDTSVPPACGDGKCNGSETQATCCKDCGCAAGSSCSGSSCVPDPYCGDGKCNGSETQSTCCTDCGCGTGYSCVSNACSCSAASMRFVNVLPDNTTWCVSTSSSYVQKSTAYINLGSGWVYMPKGGWADYPGPIGKTFTFQQQCCYIDYCGGSLSCPTPTGSAPCICTSVTTRSATITACGVNTFNVCN